MNKNQTQSAWAMDFLNAESDVYVSPLTWDIMLSSYTIEDAWDQQEAYVNGFF